MNDTRGIRIRIDPQPGSEMSSDMHDYSFRPLSAIDGGEGMFTGSSDAFIEVDSSICGDEKIREKSKNF